MKEKTLKEKDFDNYLRMKNYLIKNKGNLTMGQLEVLLFIGRRTQDAEFIGIDELARGIGANKHPSYEIVRNLRDRTLPLVKNEKYLDETNPGLIGLTKDGRKEYGRILK